MKKFIAYLACAIAFYVGLWLAVVGVADGNRWMIMGAVALFIATLVVAGYASSRGGSNNNTNE